MMEPSPEQLLEEAARLAYHYKWSLDSILDMEHRDRRRFLTHADAFATRGE